MKRLSEEEAQNVDTNQPQPNAQTQSGGNDATMAPTRTDGTEPQQSGEDSMDDMFPEGVDVMEGEIPETMIGPQPTGPDEGATGEADHSDTSDEATAEDTGEEGQDAGQSESSSDGAEQADDVATSATVEKVRRQAGLNVEDDDELVASVKEMRRDLEGTQELRDIAFEKVPELGQVIESMYDASNEEGQLDTVSFLMSLEQVPGVQVNVPDPSEAPDEHDDFRLNMRERRRKLQKQRSNQEEMQQKQQAIVDDYERAFEGFKERKGLDDEEAEDFKEEFRKTFYGDYERGLLPRDDIFDMAYEAMNEEEDAPVEETPEYQEGYNAAIEEMKQKGASDGVPNMMSGGGSQSDQPKQSSTDNDVMNTLYSEEELQRQGETMHDQF